MSDPALRTDAPCLKIFASDGTSTRSRRTLGDHTNGAIVRRYVDHLKVRLAADDLSAIHLTAQIVSAYSTRARLVY